VLETEPGGVGTSPLIPDLEKGEEIIPNLTITSHIAWFSQKTVENISRMLQEGLEGYVSGTLSEPTSTLEHIVIVHGGKIWR
jgi:lactate dehydrogenase-like 2-hydroxyacid dehydrogenase